MIWDEDECDSTTAETVMNNANYNSMYNKLIKEEGMKNGEIFLIP